MGERHSGGLLLCPILGRRAGLEGRARIKPVPPFRLIRRPGGKVSLLFIACMVALSGSLVAFIRDINLSLGALKLELGHQGPEE